MRRYDDDMDCLPGAMDRMAKGEPPIILKVKALANRPPGRIDLPNLASLARRSPAKPSASNTTTGWIALKLHGAGGDIWRAGRGLRR